VSTIDRFRPSADVDAVRLGRLLLPVFVLVVWQFGAMMTGESIASPMATYQSLLDGVTDGWLINALYVTMSALVAAFVIAVAIGIPVGVVLGMSDFWGEAYEPILLSAYSIPKIVLIPVFLLVFGIGVSYRVAFAAFHGLFPIAIVVMGGIKSIDDIHLKVGQINQLTRMQMFREIVAPSMSLPLVIALRLGLNLTFLGLILGELIQSSGGLGFQLMRSLSIVATDRIFAINTVIVVFAVGINYVLYQLERRLSRRVEYSPDDEV
jgi:NitT/TauT family transport system permease protein